MVKDPVCGMEVDPGESNWVVEHEGADYYFCSERCQKAFVKDPDKNQMRRTAHGRSGERGQTGGCCGGGMSRGLYSYLYLAIMILFMILLLFR